MYSRLPIASFTRYNERKVAVVVDIIDLLRAMKERPAADSEARILELRPSKVLVQVDNRHMRAGIVRSDTVIGSFGKVERVTLMLPDGDVVLLALDDARELAPKQAVWAVRYDEPVKIR